MRRLVLVGLIAGISCSPKKHCGDGGTSMSADGGAVCVENESDGSGGSGGEGGVGGSGGSGGHGGSGGVGGVGGSGGFGGTGGSGGFGGTGGSGGFGGTGGSGGFGGTGGSGGFGGTGGTGGTGGSGGGCDTATGQGCACTQNTDCVTVQGLSSRGFCSNGCTTANQATTCALLPGSLGVGLCALVANPDGGTTADHCAVLCGANGQTSTNTSQCPNGFVGMLVSSTCVCVPP